MRALSVRHAPRKPHRYHFGSVDIVQADGEGRPAALIDRCPHRGVALSLGKLCYGIVECPFHGWRFDATGANRLVPWNPDAKTETLRGVPVPVRDAVGCRPNEPLAATR